MGWNPEEEPASLLSGFGLEEGEEGWLAGLRAALRGPGPGRAGRFEDVEEIGRGGQGVVYKAWDPRRGAVALKRLWGIGLRDRESTRRLARELEATAALEHPAIVRVFGVEGVGEDAVLAMEWIDGEPIDRWVARELPERPAEGVLALFERVAGAVQHAHQRGVLHRDLKPSNVLVDARGGVHLLDFGLAKLSGEAGARGPTLTAQFLGTPAYCAPEQLAAARDVDVRADVYSLGVLCFQLLTGALPYDLPDDPVAWIRGVEHQDQRRLGELRPRLGRELELVLSRAMHPEREERYASVDALVADLGRFSRGEPVEAHPPTLAYQVRKLVRRRPWPFATGALLLVGAVAFSFWSTVQAGLIRDQRDRAVEAESLAEARLDALQRAWRATADQSRRAEAVLQFLIEDVLWTANPAVAPEGFTVLEAVERAARDVDLDLEGEPTTRASVHFALGLVFRNLSRLEEAEQHFLEAERLHAEHLGAASTEAVRARAARGGTLALAGRTEEAAPLIEAALEHQARLSPELRHGSWRTHEFAGELEAARRNWEAAEEQYLLAVQGHLEEHGREPAPDAPVWRGIIYALRGQGLAAESRAVLEDLLPSLEAAEVEHDSQRSLARADLLALKAVLLLDAGDHGGAEELSREVLALRLAFLAPQSPWVGVAQYDLGKALVDTGRPGEAERLARAAHETIAREWGEDHPRALSASSLWARALVRQARFSEAAERYRDLAARTRRVFGAERPEVAETLGQLGWALGASGELREAEALVQEGRRIVEGTEYVLIRARLDYNLGTIYIQLGRYAEAEEAFGRAVPLFADHRPWEPTHATAEGNLGRLAARRGDLEDAAEHAGRAVQLERSHRLEGPRVESLLFQGEMLLDLDLEAARAVLEEAGSRAQTPADRMGVGILLGTVFLRQGEVERGEAQLLAAWEEVAAAGARGTRHEQRIAQLLVEVYVRTGREDEARPWREY